MADVADEQKTNEVERIILRVLGPDTSILRFKMKKISELKKLMDAYCERSGFGMGDIRFCFNGYRIHETDTPASLEMEEEDMIEVYQQTIGGFCLTP